MVRERGADGLDREFGCPLCETITDPVVGPAFIGAMTGHSQAKTGQMLPAQDGARP